MMIIVPIALSATMLVTAATPPFITHSARVVDILSATPSPDERATLPDVKADGSQEQAVAPHALMDFLSDELTYSMSQLEAEDGTKPYYLNYTVYEEHKAVLSATLGALVQDRRSDMRKLNIDLRVGDYSLDNTHQLRGGGAAHASGSGNIRLSLEDDPYAIKHTLWYHTDRVFKRAKKRLARVKTNLKVKVDEEDKSDDFSREESHVHYEVPATLAFDRTTWADRIRKISSIARRHPQVQSSSVSVAALAATRFMVTSEKTRLQTAARRYRIMLSAYAKAKDGMDIRQSFSFDAAREERLPDDAEIEAAFRGVIQQVLALRDAPIAEPYTGPAILRNRASAVFFHEIFGHRIEGHRQKDVTEGHTFGKRIGQPVLPEFLSVYDDPTQSQLGEIDLRGHYDFDDEGVKTSRVTLVDRGILKTFLMSRRPIEAFAHSNGHGRREPGRAIASRQANLAVQSTKQVPLEELKRMLVDECRRQGKPYGLLFDDISGGFTTTGRRGAQVFKVLPVVVYRIYADGRPDELIRGVDIVGTPLTCFEKIIATGDDPAVFNGSCGAESGWVPVSAVSPSILVSTIEIEKRSREQSRPPILDPPVEGSP